MTTSRFQSGRSSVVVEINDEKARRVFVQFADKDARKRAEKVADAARSEAPVGKGPTAGKLRSSIGVTQSRELSGRYTSGYDVTANVPYAVFVHEGTRAHKIEGNPLLAFDWPKMGGFVVFRHVNHPGTTGNPFMKRALRRAR